MHKLPLLILCVVLSQSAWGQSPHGDSFAVDCKLCHTSASWDFDASVYAFDHDSTIFPLEGQHQTVDCRSCHNSLEFALAQSQCAECHQDIHNQTVGTDCQRCHNAESWLVTQITEIHEQNGFPLVGVHRETHCTDCHISDNLLQFQPMGHECISCHQQDYLATIQPNHSEANYSTDCSECHSIFAYQWSAEGFQHDFFPLKGGHEIEDCASCHQSSDYADISSECISCHLEDYSATANPDHERYDFSDDCASCHTTDINWQPARFVEHDLTFFPIYSGEHNGAWDDCAACHIQENDLSVFSCLECHEHNQADMDEEHRNVTGYSYHSTSCLACHPSGNSEGGFDHSRTAFPLTGAHTSVECLECHSDGYAGTSTFCADCHTQDFTVTTNPNHQQLNLSNDCASCHTTDPGWSPASFAVHNDFYVLNGAHAAIATDCASCHNGDYSNTPNTCAGCHIDDYNATTNPPHQSSGFSNDCASCHSENAWQPADFDHDNAYFPIYSGTHQGAWESCAECHTTEGNFSAFSCLECHEHNQTDMSDVHQGISGYSYASDACLACHPTGTSDGAFDHNTTNFPLTGAHTSVECLECHSDGYAGTSTFCADCHTQDFTATTNPNHQQLNLSNDCASCHTTDPGWSPASFAVHNDFYVLNGAHAAIATDCASCHNGDYSNTPNTCAGCHIDDYNVTTNPPHQSSGFSNDCASCHSETAWQPADFDHDNAYFPIYSGTHQGAWESCAECHTTEGNFSVFSCLECHEHNQTDMSDVHQGISGYNYASDACLACHPTGTSDGAFDHNTTNFPLTGAHTSVECLECHGDGYAGTSTFCADCHTQDFTATTNPNHQQLNLSNDCASCHTTDPGWSPASFAVHNDFYVLNGAHAAIATDCASCHNGDYSNTPNTCAGCHIDDYNATTNPPHQSSGFSNDCASCHSENAWQPADFDHDNAYFPIYSGTHQGAWESCAECHTTEGNFSVFSCLECHEHNQTDMSDVHQGISGYSYASDACLACHPTGTSDGAFDHNTTNFPLTGAHTSVECLECHSDGYAGTSTFCADCHTQDFTTATNPNHQQLNLSNDCGSCHTTDPGWSPASFAVHNDFYVLNGAHAAIASDCASCHNGDYSNTPNTCAGCHIDDYNATTNPPHQSSGFSNDCASCHSENAWQPANFDHDSQFFPIYSGKHQGEWDQCSDCHLDANNYAVFSCIDCHEHNNRNEVDNDHDEVNGYMYNSIACLSCHPTGED